MSLVLQSSGGGSITVQEPSTASNFTQTLPAGDGVVAVQGVSSNIVSGSETASTSGTAVSFTGIPSWAQKITVLFNEVSTNSTSGLLVRLGTTSGFESTGYVSTGASLTTTTSAQTSATNGFVVRFVSSTGGLSGSYTFYRMGVSSNTYVGSLMAKGATNISLYGGGSKTTAGALDSIQVVTSNGTDIFDAGSINILYE